MNRGTILFSTLLLFFPILFLFFRCSHGVVVLLVLWFSSLGSQEWRLLQLFPWGFGIDPSAPRACILRYLKMARGANQREPLVLSFSVENDRHQRRRQNSSSVRTFTLLLVTCIDLGTRVVPSACGAILLRHLEVRGSRHIGLRR